MPVVATPTYPVVGDLVTLTLTNPLGNSSQGEITSIPSTSTNTVGLMLDSATGLPIATFTPTAAGVYGVKVHDYRTQARVPSFKGDPAGADVSKYKNTQAGSVYVGVVEDLPIRTLRGHGATLRLTVVDSTVRAAALVAPLSEISRKAILDATVVTALAGLVGIVTSALDVSFVTDVVNLRLKYEAHRVNVSGGPPIHSFGGDTINIARYKPPTSIETALATLNDLYDEINAHQIQGPGGGQWHATDDSNNNLVTPKARTLAQAIVMKADLRERAYERHRVQTVLASAGVHGAPDNTNAMAAPLPMPIAIVAFLDAIVAVSATAPTGELQGATDVEHGLGFKPA